MADAYKNLDLSFKDRARDLVLQMTIEEKVSQMVHDAPAIERLGVPAYNWWNECLHGVARAGVATVFPQAIGLAAMWNVDLMGTIADAISTEGRAKHHEAVRQGDHGMYRGLTFWTPNINIFRDPRWGRGHETYGEDPYLTSRLGVAFVKGIQGDIPASRREEQSSMLSLSNYAVDDRPHPSSFDKPRMLRVLDEGNAEKYLKAVATPKHFAVHSGPEKDRHAFDAVVGAKDMWETYLPAFEACVKEAKAVSVMGAYNRTNGEPCCASKTLLIDILRDEWGFEGYVVSDCGAIQDIHQHHQVTTCTAESAALSVTNGCDLECGCVYASLLTALDKGLISVKTIDTALVRLFTARFRLGMFDPPEQVPYAQIPYEANDCEEHRALALQAARQSIVLLKNTASPAPDTRHLLPVLPLSKEVKSIAVIGPNADSLDVLLGNYFGTPSKYVTPLAGIRNAVSSDTRVWYAKGCELLGSSTDGFSEAVSAAQRSEVVVMCLGLSPQIEGEAGDAYNSDAGGDRTHIDLTGVQQQLLERIVAIGKPVVLVLINGSALAINWANEHVPAIVEAWYPGEEGGTAIADLLFGEYNPSGRLPITFPKSLDQLPPFDDYSMQGRTYRYMTEEPLYPFGYGLSYTTFEYSDLSLTPPQSPLGNGGSEVGSHQEVKIGTDDSPRCEGGLGGDLAYSPPYEGGAGGGCDVTVTNTGDYAGDEVVQLYLTDLEASTRVPIRSLIGFQRVSLDPGQAKEVSFTITSEQMKLVNDAGERVLESGKFRVEIGGWAGKSALSCCFDVVLN